MSELSDYTRGGKKGWQGVQRRFALKQSVRKMVQNGMKDPEGRAEGDRPQKGRLQSWRRPQ